MEEKTLLKEVMTKKESQVVKEPPASQPSIEKEIEKEKKKAFSSSSFPAIELERLKQKYAQAEEEQEKEINKLESKVSTVIEKPNYDNLETLTEVERKKVFVVKKSEAKKTGPSKFKVFIVSLLFAIFGIWGIINIASIDSISNQISQLSTQYELNLANYLKNLYMLDATNSENMENLFETIPDESLPPTQIEAKSNWFDRFCNFLEGLFGG